MVTRHAADSDKTGPTWMGWWGRSRRRWPANLALAPIRRGAPGRPGAGPDKPTGPYHDPDGRTPALEGGTRGSWTVRSARSRVRARSRRDNLASRSPRRTADDAVRIQIDGRRSVRADGRRPVPASGLVAGGCLGPGRPRWDLAMAGTSARSSVGTPDVHSSVWSCGRVRPSLSPRGGASAGLPRACWPETPRLRIGGPPTIPGRLYSGA